MSTRTFAVRIDQRKYDTVARLARRRHATVSDAVREALDAWIQQAQSEAARRTPYAILNDLMGFVEQGRPATRATRRRGTRGGRR